MRRRTIGPASSRLGEGLAGRDFLIPSRSSYFLWQAGRLQADFDRQLDSVSSDTLVRLASGLCEQCVKKQCGFAGSCFGGRMALNLRLSRVRIGFAAMGQDYNYQLDITKKGVKVKRITALTIDHDMLFGQNNVKYKSFT